MVIAFKHPEYLYFLFCITIPIIIHLFSFRRHRKIFFHNIQIIKNIQQEQQNIKSKLKELLILICRIAMIAFLVLTFAQPYIPQNSAERSYSNPAVAFYIDNSFSMQLESENGVLLEYAKTKTLEIAETYPINTKFFVFTNSQNLDEFQSKTRSELASSLAEIDFCAITSNFSDVFKRMQMCARKNAVRLHCHIISDCQKNTFDVQNIPTDSTILISLYNIENQSINNISVDSCYSDNKRFTRSENEKITAKITNNSNETYHNFPIKLYINDTLRSIASANLKPLTSSFVPIEYNIPHSKIRQCKIEIEDYPILYDNVYYFSYTVDDEIRILDIYDRTPNKQITSLCKGRNELKFNSVQINEIDYSDLQNYQIFVLDVEQIPTGLLAELQNLLTNGITVIYINQFTKEDHFLDIGLQQISNIFGKTVEFESTGSTQNISSINEIDLKNAIFKDLFENSDFNKFEKIQTYGAKLKHENGMSLIKNSEGTVLFQLKKSNSLLYAFTAPLHDNFSQSPLFMSIYNMFFQTSMQNELQTTLGNSANVFLPNANISNELRIINLQKNIDAIPEFRNDINGRLLIKSPQAIRTAGNYTLTLNGEPMCGISYNYSRQESNFDFYSTDELQKLSTQIPQSKVFDISDYSALNINELNREKSFWKITLWLAIASLLAEVFIIVFYDKIVNKQYVQ